MITAQESITAKICSFARAYHSTMGKEKIFDDYLAYDILGKEEYARLDGLLREAFSALSVKPRYGFENVWLFEALDRCFAPVTLPQLAFAEGELENFVKVRGRVQYVICGAGMDTFAYRNANPAITVFELDLPKTQAYKQERLRELAWKAAGKIRFIPVDFSKDELAEGLAAAGFSTAAPTFFSMLGVAYYLPYPVLAHFIWEIGALATAGDRFAFDFPDETTLSRQAPERMRELAAITESLGEPMQSGSTLDEIWRALHAAGFAVVEHESPSGVQQKYYGQGANRQKAFENIHFILAEKQSMN